MDWAKAFRARAATAVALLAMGSGVLAAQQAPETLTGRVTDKLSGAGIQGARVVINGTNSTAQTNALGRYTIRVATTGAVTVRAFAVGYSAQSREVALGGTATADFELSPTVVRLDDIVTTATGDQRRLELGTTVGVVQVDSVVSKSPITNITDVLNSRIAGVTVQTQTGTLGGGSRIRIRGANSLSLNNEPIVIIDGVRSNNNAATGSIGVGGQASSSFNDINPDDIESVEVIKGPSAATLYGTEAANGVIAIKTKRGRAGRTTWNTYVDGGLIQDKNPYPDNYNAFGFRSGAQRNGCRLYRVASGACQAQDSVVTFNTLRDPLTSPFKNGYRSQVGANVSGGNEQIRFFLGADFDKQEGVYMIPTAERDSVLLARGISEIPNEQAHPNATRKVSFRSSISATVAKNFDIDATLGYVQNHLRLPQNDNNVIGLLSNALLGSATNPTGRWAFGVGPAASYSHTNEQRIDRITTAITGRWTPSASLSGRLVVGLDRTLQSDIDYARVGEAAPFGEDVRGNRSLNKFTIGVYTLDGAVTFQRNLSKSIGSKTTFGGQYFRTNINGTLATGNGIASGSSTIGGAVQLIAASQNVEVANGGLFVEEVVSLNDRLYVTGAARLDQASAFARSTGAVLLPKAAISYIARNRPDGNLNLVRFRGSYGASLVAPGAAVRLRTFLPVTGVADASNVATVTFGNLGNPDLKPEKSREFEAGIDASFFRDRLSVELTAYDKLTEDALVNRVLAPSLGVSFNQFFNIGSIKNQGLELGVTTQVIQGRNFAFDLALVGSLLKNRLVTLGEGIEPFPVGFAQRHVPGLPAGGYWDRKASYNDANNDGILGVDEITVSDTALYIGPALPTRELTLTPGFTLLNGMFRLTSQWNYRGGNYLDNSTEGFRCSAVANCRGLYDKSVSLDEQAYATAAFVLGGFSGDVQKADFIRLRELSLTYSAPRSVARMLRASSASMTISGRNLHVWTKYKGIDPEASAFGGGANFGASDFLTQPPLRFWTVRFNLGL